MTVNDKADRPGPADRSYPGPVSRATLFWYAFASTLLVGWFLFGWLVLRQGFVDSVGEALGTGFTLLLAVSVIEAARRHRHDGGPRPG
ncbi:hypothetical protein O7623_17905 [Solwaraspora sp. WMMD791]|uniref:hypothetical protein n=1 Tax=Solwaraspora sp. WMMD791 TaxID=3016086 RepID=UPI00249A308E|nr:hypothetical protein [Solwaraspora sp. WMMD791]WFE25276.1 hypothetical protein O7623_17905 [Solwaraspora sp. WMMD791]